VGGNPGLGASGGSISYQVNGGPSKPTPWQAYVATLNYSYSWSNPFGTFTVEKNFQEGIVEVFQSSPPGTPVLASAVAEAMISAAINNGGIVGPHHGLAPGQYWDGGIVTPGMMLSSTFTSTNAIGPQTDYQQMMEDLGYYPPDWRSRQLMYLNSLPNTEADWLRTLGIAGIASGVGWLAGWGTGAPPIGWITSVAVGEALDTNLPQVPPPSPLPDYVN
jgi:hypothetical protein